MIVIEKTLNDPKHQDIYCASQVNLYLSNYNI